MWQDQTFCPELLQRFPVSRFHGKGFLAFAQNSLVLFWKFKKKGGEDTFWMNAKVISLSIHTPHGTRPILTEEPAERWELLAASLRGPWPFWRRFQHPSFLFLSPAPRSLWCDRDKDSSSLPGVLAHSAWWCPSPEVPGDHTITFCARLSPEARCSEWRRNSEPLNDDRGAELKKKRNEVPATTTK